MADIEQLKRALIQAHRNGDTQAAELFASRIKQMQQPQQAAPSMLDQARSAVPIEDDSYTAQGLSGVNQGIANTLGLPVDLANSVISLAKEGSNYAFGTDFERTEKPYLGSAHISDMMRSTGSIRPESEDTSKRMLRTVGEYGGSAVIPGSIAARSVKSAPSLAAEVGKQTGIVLSSGVPAAAAREAYPDNPMVEMAASLAGGIPASMYANRLDKLAARKAKVAKVPTTEQNRQMASQLYDEAEQMGASAPPSSIQSLRDNVRDTLKSEGVLSPSGTMADDYSRLKNAMRHVDDYAETGGSMNPSQMMTMRRAFKKGMLSQDADERRVAGHLMKHYEDMTDPLMPQLKQGNNLYSRYIKSDQLDTIDDLIEDQAHNFSQSGTENAIRRQYSSLNRDIIKGRGRGRGWTPEEIEAIRKVRYGTPLSNAAQWGGKFAPTGVMPVGTSAIGGTLIDTVLPGAGWITAAGALGVGSVARALATRLGISYKEAAQLLIRNGGKIPPEAMISQGALNRGAATMTGIAANNSNMAANTPDSSISR
jgi:hypothetical protein